MIGYRADHKNALRPPAWRGLNLLGKALQIVRQRLRDRAPPPVRRQHASPPRGDSPAQSRDYIFEVDPSFEERLSACDAPTAPSGYSAILPNVPPDRGGDVFSVTTTAGHIAQNVKPLVEQGPCLVPGIITMDHSSFTTKIKIHSGPSSSQFGLSLIHI